MASTGDSKAAAQTPPHHPTYGVQMSSACIEELIRLCFPDVESISISPLPRGRSYNNRIYFIKAQSSSNRLDVDQKEQELVLKVNGRFFGASKIENEVGCLRLLEAFCTDIPTPRALAWSGNGQDVMIASNEHVMPQKLPKPSQENHGGWILMSKLPGEPLSLCDLDIKATSDVAVQLADHVTNWRRLIPPQKLVGNLRFKEGEFGNAPPDIVLPGQDGLNSSGVIRGFLQDGLNSFKGVGTVDEYFKIRLEDKIKRVKVSETYAPNRSLVPLLEEFAADTLPKLRSVSLGASEFIFTHYDLSPRNVLLSGSPPRISGIVDFEFAGFFSPLEEFLNDYVGNNGDWPKEVYDVYLQRLEHNGIDTPAKSIGVAEWEQFLWLEKLLQNTAPWWLPGEHRGQSLEAELKKSELIVREMLRNLARVLSDT
jgi:Phosphotransferase enzyme family